MEWWYDESNGLKSLLSFLLCFSVYFVLLSCKVLEEESPLVPAVTTRYYENIRGELRTKQAKGIEGVGCF
ncbi:hypothetical protein EFE42_08360 [Methanohalophilus sp. RSK]|nr:hypothetical protein EFE42_08360 [Methanohalophilus sp. RSK]